MRKYQSSSHFSFFNMLPSLYSSNCITDIVNQILLNIIQFLQGFDFSKKFH